MRVIELTPGASSRQWGQSHGESFRGEIRSLAALRTHLTVRIGGFDDEAEVLGVAERHLPVLERYDRELFDEFMGIAEGAGVTAAQLVVVNHYTDLRDIKRSKGPAGAGAAEADLGDPGGCSILWSRAPAGAELPILAQTWDMHASAIPYVAALRVPERDGRPAAVLLTITGCLGMCGMNRLGVGIAINNLASTDARVGIVWPALVRRALVESDAAAARDRVLEAPLGSGHHYLVADREGAYGIETSGAERKVVFAATALGAGERAGSDGSGPSFYVHTNHCIDGEIAACSRIPPGSTTQDRYDSLHASLTRRPLAGVADAWARLGSDDGYPRSVCTNMATAKTPHAAATCGAIAMELGRSEVWAQAGLIHNVAPERFDFEFDSSSGSGPWVGPRTAQRP